MKTKRLAALAVYSFLTLLPIKARAQSAAQELASYLAEMSCTNSPDLCLEPVVHRVKRSTGKTVVFRDVYRVKKKGSRESVDPHMQLKFLRLLRNAGFANALVLGQLERQLEYMSSFLSHNRSASWWQTTDGFAHAMVQGEYALFFFSLGESYRRRNAKLSQHYFSTAFRFAESFDIPAGPGTGGVRSESFACGPKRARYRPCWTYHSRAGTSIGEAGTALNQTLHGVRDAFTFYTIVRDYPHPLPVKKHSRYVAALQDRVIGAMYYLAFAPSATVRGRGAAPALNDFLNLKESRKGSCSGNSDSCYYFAFYQYDLKSKTGRNLDGETNNTCHYHTHSLQVAAELLRQMDDDPKLDWRAREAADELLKTTNAKGRTEPFGAEGSRRALYQWFLTETSRDAKFKREGCVDAANENLSAADVAYYRDAFGL